MKLYHAWFSSASRRVRLCLAEKGIPYESRLMDLRRFEQHEPAYLRLNPNGMVPTLELDDGRALYESSVVNEYLDDIAPEPPLRPAEPYLLAIMRNYIRWTDERISPNLVPVNWGIVIAPEVSDWSDTQLEDRLRRIPIARRREGWARAARRPFTDQEKRDAMAGLNLLVERIDQMLAERGGPWLLGTQYTLADVHTVSYMARIHDIAPSSIERHPRVAQWWARIRARPAFVAARIGDFAEEVAESDRLAAAAR